FGYEDVPVYCWTDSSTALAWIRRNDEWGTFVGNRVKEICRLTPVDSWNHVHGIKNPADLPSRGCTSKELLESRWWEGPEWLKGSRNDWPKLEVQFDENAILAEKKKSAVTAMLHLEPGPIWYIKFSNFLKNIRMVAWIQRFIFNARARTNGSDLKDGELTLDEIQAAEIKV